MSERNAFFKALAHYTPLQRHPHILFPTQNERKERTHLTRMDWLLLAAYVLLAFGILWLLFAVTTVPILSH